MAGRGLVWLASETPRAGLKLTTLCVFSVSQTRALRGEAMAWVAGYGEQVRGRLIAVLVALAVAGLGIGLGLGFSGAASHRLSKAAYAKALQTTLARMEHRM